MYHESAQQEPCKSLEVSSSGYHECLVIGWIQDWDWPSSKSVGNLNFFNEFLNAFSNLLLWLPRNLLNGRVQYRCCVSTSFFAFYSTFFWTLYVLQPIVNETHTHHHPSLRPALCLLPSRSLFFTLTAMYFVNAMWIYKQYGLKMKFKRTQEEAQTCWQIIIKAKPTNKFTIF